MPAGDLGITWAVSPAALGDAVLHYGTNVESSAKARLGRLSGEALAYARSHHPWANRTGAAEAGLGAEVHEVGGGLQMILYHGVPYGVFLEVRHGGKWGIIRPTLDAFGPKVMAEMRAALSGN